MNEYSHILQPAEHEVYLLRVWYELDGARSVWRASVLLHDDPQRRYFATPDALLHFLEQQFQDRSPVGADPTSGVP